MDDAVIDGETIRHLREARGLTMVDLARAAGIDHAVISRLERGLQRDLTVSALIGLARALGVAVDTLLAVSPEVRRGSGALIGELGAAVAALEELTERQQRYAAALLRAYQAALHDDTMDRREDEARDA